MTMPPPSHRNTPGFERSESTSEGGRAGPRVSIILTCYNEQDHLMLELERITRAMDASGYTYELLVIDDGSTDGRLKVLREADKPVPRAPSD